MQVIRLLVTLAAALVACDTSLAQTTPTFTLEDLAKFHEMDVRMRPIANDIGALITNPPTQNGPEAATLTQDCMIKLAGTHDGATRMFNVVELIIGLSARMHDADDRFFTNAILGTQVSAFLSQIKDYQAMLNATVGRCRKDGATTAKAQEMTRLFKEATTLVEMVAKRLGVSPQ